MRLRRAAIGPKSRLFPVAPPKAKPWKSSCKTFAKRSKDACPLRSRRPSRAASNGCWNCLREIRLWTRIRSSHRATQLDICSGLAAVTTSTARAEALSGRFAAPPDEAGRIVGRRPLSPLQIIVRLLAERDAAQRLAHRHGAAQRFDR